MQHDLVAQGADGQLYSVEVKCYEVQKRDPLTFNWRSNLLNKTLAKWTKEVSSEPAGTWVARVLVFVELEYHCHRNGKFTTHGAKVKVGCNDFEYLWGWRGFPLPSQALALPVRLENAFYVLTGGVGS